MKPGSQRQFGGYSGRGAGVLPLGGALTAGFAPDGGGSHHTQRMATLAAGRKFLSQAREPVDRPKEHFTYFGQDFRALLGPLFTMAVIVALHFSAWYQQSVLYLPMALIIAVVVSAYVGGMQQAAISAGLAWVFLGFYLLGSLPSLSEWLTNWAIWTSALAVLAILTGLLAERARAHEGKPWKGNLAPFQMASDSMFDFAVILVDREGVISSWNTGASSVFGWSSSEMNGQTLDRCYAGEEKARGVPKRLWMVAAEQGRCDQELWCLRKNGPRFRAKVAVRSVCDENNTVAGYTLSVLDLTERQQSESELRRRAQQTVAIAALSHEALRGSDPLALLDMAITLVMDTWSVDFCEIFELQADGKTLVVRAAGGWRQSAPGRLEVQASEESILGYTLKSAEPVIIQDLRLSNHLQVPEFLLEQGLVSSITVAIPGDRRPFGIIGVHSRKLTSFHEDDLRFLQAVASVLATAHARTAAETQLRQSQKMEAIGQLASGVAHDFNNILTIMQGYSTRLLSRYPRVDQREDLEQILNTTERAASLTRQLLAFSRRQKIQPRLLDLREVVVNMSKMLGRLIGETISLKANNPEHLPAVSADSGMMEQILLNLVVNARDAMPEGGTVVVETLARQVDEAHQQRQPQARPGSFVVIKVIDTGCGMDKATMARIFEPFFTTKAPGKGTGLGLATVHDIVHRHEGWMEVESEVGRGTTFSVFLPAAPGQIDVPKAEPSAELTLRGGTETILVAEDEALLRELAVAVLRELGYTVLEASNGLEALVVWKQNRDTVSLLITDMVMPGGLTGRELGEQLRKDKPALRIIFSSGYSADVAGMDFDAAKGTAFLQKPYRPPMLAKTVRDCLDAN